MGANDRTGVGSGSDEWRTPRDLFERLDRTFRFDYDAFASDENALCSRYSTKDHTVWRAAPGTETKQDGLPFEWLNERVFMNPPYSRGFIAQAMAKATGERNNAEVIIALIPANTDTRWWHEFVEPYPYQLLKGRIRFLHPDGTPGDAPPGGSALVFYYPDWRPS